MIYYQDENILIRSMKESDPQVIYKALLAQGWHPTLSTYEGYYKDQENKVRHIIVAEYQGEVAGYTTLFDNDTGGPFANQGIPVIVDFAVFVKFQKKGIGNKILDVTEALAAQVSDYVSLSVGLHHGYGAAHRIYIKRGYIPDGSGAWYGGKVLPEYTTCCVDDDLVLYLSKKLK